MLTYELTDPRPKNDVPLKGVRPNIVQGIRALSRQELQAAAALLGHTFLYADLGNATCKQDILDMLAAQCALPGQSSKSMETLSRGLTEHMPKPPAQLGFIVVIERIPAHAKFDKETREQLLDIFRDAADYWSERKLPFRCFYTFAVARKPVPVPAGQKNLLKPILMEGDEPMPTDKLCDVSPLALRMSSPFNARYWRSAA
ncbi:Barstar (barnase inhibitor) domain-containing protein [Polaromonas hydrogenivorans]